MQYRMEFDPDLVVPDIDYDTVMAAEHANTDLSGHWRDDIASILATDVGSTTTKAILWHRDSDGGAGDFHLVGRTEAPTTVESPWLDVTLGLTHAIERLEQAAGVRILRDGEIISPPDDGVGVDLYISTSSAGGGLQMVVAGVMKTMTAQTADRAAQAAGAIVTDVLSIDDGRMVIDHVQRLRDLRPDIILMAGGADGGDISHVVNLAEQVAVAEPTTRLHDGHPPLVFAGNAAARPHVTRLLGGRTDLRIVDNIRPVLERENITPARDMIHQLFMEHVMSQAPGYERLLAWSQSALMPTPGAVGRAIEAFGRKYGINVAAFDIGGATTDVFTLSDGKFRRTVSANLGMSYSATNVLAEAGAANVLRWLPFELAEGDLLDWAANKMIRPTSLPDTLADLLIEQAIAREALRLSVVHHQRSTMSLSGVMRQRDIGGETFEQKGARPAIDWATMDALIGSGGVLSHAPRRAQAALMLLDALQPEGFTELFIDSIFMSPQLGLLSTINAEVATSILERDGLALLGPSVAPVGPPARAGRLLAKIRWTHAEESGEAEVRAGRLTRVPLTRGGPYELRILPQRDYDVGSGPGRYVEAVTEAGLFGLLLDGRGRPLAVPTALAQRITALRSWLTDAAAFTTGELDSLAGSASRR